MTIVATVQVVLNGLTLGLTLALVALGLSLIFGIMHIVNFAHGEIYMLGGFGVWIFTERLPLPGPDGARYFMALLLTMVLVGIFGLILEKFFFRPFRGEILTGFLLSMGFIMILQGATFVAFGVDAKAAPSPFSGVFRVAGAVISKERVMVILVSLGSIAVLYYLLKRSRLGQAMRATAQDPEVASIQGVSMNRMTFLAMGIGCAMAALAGSLLGSVFFITPYMGAPVLMKAFAAIVLGGIGSIAGTLLGAMIIGFVEAVGGLVLGAEMAAVLVFVVLILVLLVKPSGLMGHA